MVVPINATSFVYYIWWLLGFRLYSVYSVCVQTAHNNNQRV